MPGGDARWCQRARRGDFSARTRDLLRAGACALIVLIASLVITTGGSLPKARASGGAPDGRPYTLLVSSVPGARPLLVVLHGWRLDGLWMQHDTGLDAAVRLGYDVAYLDGVDEAWDAGSCCGAASADHIDDVDYVRAVTATVEEQHPIARNDVYAVGFSNGGMLAWRLACDRVVDAAVVVAGSLVARCPDPVTVLNIHGTHDRTVPYLGGYSKFTSTWFPNENHLSLPRDSHVTTALWDGGHVWPSWATPRLLAWLAQLEGNNGPVAHTAA